MDTARYMQEVLRLAETGMKKGDGGPFGASRDDARAIGFDDALIYKEVCLPRIREK